jgi:hypothetical protein
MAADSGRRANEVRKPALECDGTACTLGCGVPPQSEFGEKKRCPKSDARFFVALVLPSHALHLQRTSRLAFWYQRTSIRPPSPTSAASCMTNGSW